MEIANAVLGGERRKRLSQPEIEEFTALLGHLTVVQEMGLVSEQVRDVLPLARAHGLSAYTAAYLELSIRHGAPLSTLDEKLRKAANVAGVPEFAGE
jgi:predicted nucleic acid-binding protein